MIENTARSLARLVVLLLVVGAGLGAWSYAHAQEPKSVTLQVPKMYCVACEITVKKALTKVPGVGKVDVDLDKKLVVVRFDSTKASVDDLIHASTKAGFPASLSQ